MAEEIDAQLQMKLLFQLLRIRQTEEAIAQKYPEGKMRCPIHLSIGQEAVAAASSQTFTLQDVAVSSHRSHAHYLAKGGDLNAMIAELHGKESGCSGGRGGSMHLVDLDVGFEGSTAIVGNTIPIGVGLALAKQTKGESGVAVVYLGDGATEEGVFYESANFAALRQLPVVFICENNEYSVYSPLSSRQPPARDLCDLAESLGLVPIKGDGYDVEECLGRLRAARALAYSEGRPVFAEFRTHRWREHCGPNFDDELGYRQAGELDHWLSRDPIATYQNYLLESGVVTSRDIETNIRTITEEIDRAFELAEQASYPPSRSASEYVYRTKPSWPSPA